MHRLRPALHPGSTRMGHPQLMNVAQQMDHPNAIATLRGTVVLPLHSTTTPYQPRRHAGTPPT